MHKAEAVLEQEEPLLMDAEVNKALGQLEETAPEVEVRGGHARTAEPNLSPVGGSTNGHTGLPGFPFPILNGNCNGNPSSPGPGENVSPQNFNTDTIPACSTSPEDAGGSNPHLGDTGLSC